MVEQLEQEKSSTELLSGQKLDGKSAKIFEKQPFTYNKGEHKKPIPIYYVPVHPKDRNKRDCLSWSVLYGATTAKRVSSALSKWTMTNQYYVSFPYGVYEPNILRDHRKDISSPRPFFI